MQQTDEATNPWECGGAIGHLGSVVVDNNFYYLRDGLIDMKNIKYVDYEEHIRVEGRGREILHVFTDIDKPEAEMLEKAPEDKDLITDFTNAVSKFAKFNLPIEKPPELYNLLDWIKIMLKLIRFWRAYKQWSHVPVQECANKCKNLLLKRTFEFMFVKTVVSPC